MPLGGNFGAVGLREVFAKERPRNCFYIMLGFSVAGVSTTFRGDSESTHGFCLLLFFGEDNGESLTRVVVRSVSQKGHWAWKWVAFCRFA